jgi:Ca2+-binding EF-hand superfamily protein
MERDKKRYKVADNNNDGKLDKMEFTDFLHPEESKLMREIVVDVSFFVVF